MIDDNTHIAIGIVCITVGGFIFNGNAGFGLALMYLGLATFLHRSN